MKKRYKICIIIFVIQFVFTFFYNTHVLGLYSSLSEFVEKNGIENMTNKELEEKYTEALNKIKDDTQKTTVSQAVANIISGIVDEKSYSDEKKMEELNKAFIQNQGDAYGDPTESDLYYGYMLGKEWLTYKKNVEESKKGTDEGKSIAEQFDEKYNEYKNLSDEEKNVNTLMDYYNTLKSLYDQLPSEEKTNERTEKLDEVDTAYIDADRSAMDIPDTIYQYPNKIDGSTAGSLDDMIGDADSFLAKANSDVVTSASLQSFSQSFYNILLTVGIIVAVLVGLVIGIRFMVGGTEEKANVKELLIPYIVGCIVVFGAFTIWKIVVTILQGV